MRPFSSGILSLPLWPSITEKEILQKYDLSRLINMGSNENCYGASAAAYDAMRNVPAHRYPDLHASSLRKKIASRFNVSHAQVLTGNGSSEIIQMIAQTYLQPGLECVTAFETFPVYSRAVAVMDATCIRVPLKSYACDLRTIGDHINANTRVVFIANPNNPTGTCVDSKELRDFLRSVPSNVLVVLDEAYRDYQDDAADTIAWLSEYENLLLLRTFSKVYGLAGLRVGYAIASLQIIEDLHRVRLPYTVNAPAQAAAMAALEDEEHVRRCVRLNREQRDFLQREFEKRGYDFVRSQTNFILLKKDVAESLLKNGILVARMEMFGMPETVRITLGTEQENRELLEALPA